MKGESGQADRQSAARQRARPRREDPVLRAVALATGAIAGLWIVTAAMPALVLVYASVVLAAGMAPAVRRIERRQVPFTSYRPSRGIAAALLYGAAALVLAGLALVVVPAFVDQARQFVDALPGYVDRAQSVLVAHGVLARKIPAEQLVQRIPGRAALGTLTGTAWGIAGVIGALVALVFLTFYLLLEGERLFHGAIARLPAGQRAHAESMGPAIVERVSAWMLGQLMLSAIAGTTAAVVLGLMGVPYFYVLALLNAGGDLVPYVGPIVAAVPAVLLAATESMTLAIGVAVFYVVLYQVEGNVIVPKIMQREVGLPPSVVLIAVLVGGVLLGVVGVLLAVPTAAIVAVVLDELAPEERRPRDE